MAQPEAHLLVGPEEAGKKPRTRYGLSAAEVLERRSQFGANLLPQETKISAWEILFNQDQRTILEDAAAVIKRAELKGDGTTVTESQKREVEDLRAELYRQTKNIGLIKERTAQVKEHLDRTG